VAIYNFNPSKVVEILKR
jgi:predicted component of viral defense system (DUF524 family)